MKENTQEKNLVEKSSKGIMVKIKNFFEKIFCKKKDNNIKEKKVNIENNEFKDQIKVAENEETRLLDLQKKYHNGEIEGNMLTDEQIDALCLLYDKQIAEIKKKIKMKEEQIEEYRIKRQQKMGKHSI